MRIRTIKPEFWKHPVYSRLDDQTKWLAIALLCIADDEGYFLSSPESVRSESCPFHEDVMKISGSLQKLRVIGWYEECLHPEMGPVGRITKWAEHQYVQHPKSSKIKKYWNHDIFMKDSCSPHEVVMLDQGSGNREHDSAISMEKLAKKTIEEFKASYPPNGSTVSPNVETLIAKMISEGVLPDRIISGTKAYAEKLKKELGKDYPYGKYVAQAENFLQKRQFEIDWSRMPISGAPAKVERKEWTPPKNRNMFSESTIPAVVTGSISRTANN